MYYARQDFDKAAGYYEQLIRFNPGQWQTHYNLGALYMMQARNSEAREHLLRASRLNPEFEGSKTYYDLLQGWPDGKRALQPGL
jgi:tetratricopeptide (TPR) repeat protein